MRTNDIQLPLEKSEIKLILNEIDKFRTKKELEKYLENLSLSELLEIYYTQSCEINRKRKIIKS